MGCYEFSAADVPAHAPAQHEPDGGAASGLITPKKPQTVNPNKNPKPEILNPQPPPTPKTLFHLV